MPPSKVSIIFQSYEWHAFCRGAVSTPKRWCLKTSPSILVNSPLSTFPRDTQSTLHFSDSFCDLFSSAWNLPKVSAFLYTYHKWAWGSYSKDRSYVFRHGLIAGQTAVKQWNCGAKLNRMEETLLGCLEILYILSSMHFVELFFFAWTACSCRPLAAGWHCTLY